jgi:hypothetical protein
MGMSVTLDRPASATAIRPFTFEATDAERDDDGLIVMVVHAPEFSFERELDWVQLATTASGIDYPVGIDSDYAIGGAFDNRYWPALYFVNSAGVISDHHFGEGRFEQSKLVTQQMLDMEREPVPA